MLYARKLAMCAFRGASSARSFHLGHEYTPPARFISHHARFGLALLSTAIQLSSIILLYLNADKLRPPPPRKVSEKAQAKMEENASLFENGTMSIKQF
uniref:Peptidylprolyl isomerase n=1 Tax=Elaeophora elaphi TaxID=1147741 RepID=A0A0R3S1U9_9BILA